MEPLAVTDRSLKELLVEIDGSGARSLRLEDGAPASAADFYRHIAALGLVGWEIHEIAPDPQGLRYLLRRIPGIHGWEYKEIAGETEFEETRLLSINGRRVCIRPAPLFSEFAALLIEAGWLRLHAQFHPEGREYLFKRQLPAAGAAREPFV